MQDAAAAVDQQGSTVLLDEQAGLEAIARRHRAAGPEKGDAHTRSPDPERHNGFAPPKTGLLAGRDGAEARPRLTQRTVQIDVIVVCGRAPIVASGNGGGRPAAVAGT